MCKLTLDEIKEKLYAINPNIEILSDEYINSNTKLKCKCLIDGHEWGITWSNLSRSHGCPKCKSKTIGEICSTPNGNSVRELRPDLVKFFVNLNDSDNYKVNSDKKVKLKCPKCNSLKTKEISVSKLSSRGFSCDVCSDGISLPEKFGINLFKQLNVEFETQKRFHWAKDKIYDKYFILNGEEFICEIMGIQHYEDGRGVFKPKYFKAEQDNDELKKLIAIQNGIKIENYIVIDARYSTFEHLQDNFTKQLSYIFDLNNVDWLKVWEESQLSILPIVWDVWNNRNEHDTTTTIGEIFGLDRTTIANYLKRGNMVGKCIYNTKEEQRKNGLKVGKISAKTVYQYTLDLEFVKQFESCAEAGRQLNISNCNISQCCLGKQKTAGGFKWSYNPVLY